MKDFTVISICILLFVGCNASKQLSTPVSTEIPESTITLPAQKALAGDKNAQYQMAVGLIIKSKGNRCNEAFHWCALSAAQGHKKAQDLLVQIHDNGCTTLLDIANKSIALH